MTIANYDYNVSSGQLRCPVRPSTFVFILIYYVWVLSFSFIVRTKCRDYRLQALMEQTGRKVSCPLSH